MRSTFIREGEMGEYDQRGSMTGTKGRVGSGLLDEAAEQTRRRNRELAEAAGDDDYTEEEKKKKKLRQRGSPFSWAK